MKLTVKHVFIATFTSPNKPLELWKAPQHLFLHACWDGFVWSGKGKMPSKKAPQEIEFHFCLIAAGCNFNQRLGLFNSFELANDRNSAEVTPKCWFRNGIPPKMRLYNLGLESRNYSNLPRSFQGNSRICHLHRGNSGGMYASKLILAASSGQKRRIELESSKMTNAFQDAKVNKKH